MKIFCSMLAMLLLFFSCKHSSSADTGTTRSDSAAFAYPVKNADYWITDTSHANIVIALKALKAFEKGDTAEMSKYYADTLMAEFDGCDFLGLRSQYLKRAKMIRDSLKDLSIKLYDYQSVSNKENNEAWVTTWTLRSFTNYKGQRDSLEYVQDMQFKDGKIVKTGEYVRHLKNH
ncbi:MAG TPA: nuclear transport factor 2 family protein [Mucilaginibacter sp.]|nr:nuclear transport factor 2 family protein [Mucilaginibacter sp.]